MPKLITNFCKNKSRIIFTLLRIAIINNWYNTVGKLQKKGKKRVFQEKCISKKGLRGSLFLDLLLIDFFLKKILCPWVS